MYGSGPYAGAFQKFPSSWSLTPYTHSISWTSFVYPRSLTLEIRGGSDMGSSSLVLSRARCPTLLLASVAPRVNGNRHTLTLLVLLGPAQLFYEVAIVFSSMEEAVKAGARERSQDLNPAWQLSRWG